MFLTRIFGRTFLAAARSETSAATAAAGSTARTGYNPLEEFFEAHRSPDDDKPVVYGRSWKASELRLKSWDDLNKLWYVLLKEKNMLMTQRQMLNAQNLRFPNPERIPKVRKSMCRIKQIRVSRWDRGWNWGKCKAMHGRRGENWKRSRHMWTVPTRGTQIVEADGSSSSSSSAPTSFCKGGRRISVGDCALFKPPKDSPPFIGIIRWLTTGKENKLKLGVNWLYRSSELKLGKGILLEAAPNEVFYSFHKDEIPAASLLHPCKVAFLPKDIKLPSGISSFVCRRVYDIRKKCLWWLTDQDYINEHREEVDQLLDKTRLEMHASVQPGGRSPKPTSGPTSTSQLKANSDGVQATFPSHTKGKKRERSDQGLESVKRERIVKADEGDSANCRLENTLKFEITKIAEKGSLVDSEAVEKLVQLMLSDSDKKIDLAGRSALAGVIAATDKVECLNQFVHLKGLPVLDEWLQEVHKGKIGSGSSPKDSDKAVEEFLLILLRALDKLPVNLPALQMCHIGKSVNHLRSHKNLEIQKKARSLVDTWKKRVEAEMNINDAKSGSNQAVAWSARTRSSEVAHGGRNQDASSEVAMKSSVSQLSTSKSASVKLAQDDSVTRSASASPGSMKPVLSPASASINSKDGSSRNPGVCGTADLSQTIARDEKSSSSSQSHNNSQSCSSEHGKSGGLGKEDARSSTAGSMSVNKISGGGSRQRKSVNGFPSTVLSGAQRDVGSGKSSLHRNTVLERSSQSGTTYEKASDGPIGEGNSPKLIVKITNRGRSPAHSVSGGSFEDPSIMNSRASSPPLSEKHDQFDHSKSDTCQPNITGDVNVESWQNSDVKDMVTGSDDGDGSPAAVHGEDRCQAVEDIKVSRANDHKNGKLHEASLSSINALIESCIKCSEASMPTSLMDNVGINLLASVAAVEMSKSDFVLPSDTQGNITAVDRTSRSSDCKVKASYPEEEARDHIQSNDAMDVPEQGVITTSFGAKIVDGRCASQSEEKPVGDLSGHSKSSGVNLQPTAVPFPDGCIKMNEAGGPISPSRMPEKGSEMEGAKPVEDSKAADVVDGDSSPESKPKPSSSLPDGSVVGDGISNREVEADVVNDPLHRLQEVDGNTNDRLHGVSTSDRRLSSKLNCDSAKLRNDELLQASGSSSNLISVSASEMKGEKNDETNTSADVKLEKPQSDLDPMVSESRSVGGSCSATNLEGEHMEENLESKFNKEKNGGQTHHWQSILTPVRETEQPLPSKRSKLAGAEAEEAEESTSTAADAGSMSASGVPDMDAKLEFDLNEGFNVDDGKCSEPSSIPASITTVQLISPLPFPVSISNVASNIPASITVTAAAKRPFVPPDDLLRSKGELGWKGSAATSAFRPAEPRKILEMPLGVPTASLPDAAASKISRPPLDIDLNVPDERTLEDMNPQIFSEEVGSKSGLVNNRDLARDIGSTHGRCSGGLDLDLNRVDDAPDPSSFSLNNCRRIETPLSVKSSTVRLNDKVNFHRDFDLNGPIADESTTEPSIFPQHARSHMPSQPTVSGLWMNNAEIGNFPSWFPPGNAYSAVAIPSIMPDRAEQAFPVATNGPPRILGPTSGTSPYSTDVFRGQVLSSSPAVPFPSTFQYPVLSFGNSFPLPSATFSGNATTYVDSSSGGRLCFPAVASQFLAPPGAVSTHYPRPFVVSHSDGGNNTSSDSSRKWGRQGLDLNAGPIVPDVEGREESSSLVPRQLSVASSQATTEEHMRIYQPAIGMMKRKEPEGGWDGALRIGIELTSTAGCHLGVLFGGGGE
ncbi:39S ribosomal protein L47, mitochondrial, partial [Cucurbita argyrosperma subsp. sororia]